MKQWSVTLLPVGKPRGVDNMVSCSEVSILRVVSILSICVCWAVIGSDAIKNVTCNNI